MEVGKGNWGAAKLVDVDKLKPSHPPHKDHDAVEIGVLSQQCVVWHSTKRFRISNFNPVDESKDAVAMYPFYRPLNKMMSRLVGKDWVLCSGPVKPLGEVDYATTKEGELYKPTVQFVDENGVDVGPPIDPHIAVVP